MPTRFSSMLGQSFRSIMANKGRSFLTVLGIVIGIASVIALIALGTGATASITSRISKLGSTNLIVMPGAEFNSRSDHSPGGRGPMGGGMTSTLTFEDLASLEGGEHPDVKAVSGNINGSAIIKRSGQDQRYSVVGTSAAYFSINNLNVKWGKPYDKVDVTGKNQVIVLGSEMAKELYGDSNPVGRSMIIEDREFRIAGVLADAKEGGFTNPNIQAYIPNAVASETFGISTLNSITVQAKNDNVMDGAKEDVQKTIMANHNINDAKLADFSVNSPKDLLSVVDQVTGLLTSLLAGIAGISLVVGGIGIMNIMLVSVTERTREIGLRKAVGAKTADIMSQFLVEAVTLTLMGGIIGIGLGWFAGKVAARFVGFSPIVTTSAVLMAVGVSSAVGLIFGLYPAAKASRLNPIDALRYE